MPDDPHDAPDDETPGQRRARLMNLNNPGWHPEAEPKVDEVPPPAKEEAEPKLQTAEVLTEPHPTARPPAKDK